VQDYPHQVSIGSCRNRFEEVTGNDLAAAFKICCSDDRFRLRNDVTLIKEYAADFMIAR
jgi:hypothetical protein